MTEGGPQGDVTCRGLSGSPYRVVPAPKVCGYTSYFFFFLSLIPSIDLFSIQTQFDSLLVARDT
jgi:hypothetical protein